MNRTPGNFREVENPPETLCKAAEDEGRWR